MTEREYDEFGYESKYISKDENGNPTTVISMVTEGDREDGWLRITDYDESGTITHRSECVYDSDGNRISEKQCHYSKGILDDWTEMIYDSQGNKTEYKYYIVQDGTRSKEKEMEYVVDGETIKVVLSQWTKYEYDDVGNLLRELSLNIDGEITYRVEYEYKY